MTAAQHWPEMGKNRSMRVLRFFRLFRVWRSFGRALQLMRHPAVPMHLKLIACGLALLILSPFNLLGDIPFLGLLDDVALLGLLAGWFTTAAGRYAGAVTIEGELVPARSSSRAWSRDRLDRPLGWLSLDYARDDEMNGCGIILRLRRSARRSGGRPRRRTDPWGRTAQAAR